MQQNRGAASDSMVNRTDEEVRKGGNAPEDSDKGASDSLYPATGKMCESTPGQDPVLILPVC